MKAIIISIGDELLIGQTINTNAAWLGIELNQLGIKVTNQLVISDNYDDIIETIKYAVSKTDIIIITGGLGPTKDDITKVALCGYFGSELELNQTAFEKLKKFYADRGREITETNIRQVYVPNNAKILNNSVGAAPGTFYEFENKMLFSLPGVPREMKAIFKEEIVGIITNEKDNFSENEFYSNRIIYTAGIPESTLSDLLLSVETNNQEVKIAYLPSYRGVKLRLDTFGTDKSELESNLDKTDKQIKEAIGKYYIIENTDILGAISLLLKENNLTIATAESCTGGLLGQLLTSISGSSDYYIGGIISYSNEVKMHYLDVKNTTLDEFGAVSEQTAIEMASNCRNKFRTNFAISITGIAGPNGGSDDKPVGTVYIGLSTPTGTFEEKYIFGKDREINRELSCSYALFMLYRYIQDAKYKN